MHRCANCYWRALDDSCIIQGHVRENCDRYLEKIIVDFPERDITMQRMIRRTANAPKCPMCSEVSWVAQGPAVIVCASCGYTVKFNMQQALETYKESYKEL